MDDIDLQTLIDEPIEEDTDVFEELSDEDTEEESDRTSNGDWYDPELK